MQSYRLSGRDGCMLRNSSAVIGRTVNAKSNKFAFSPSQLRQYLTIHIPCNQYGSATAGSFFIPSSDSSPTQNVSLRTPQSESI